eukprot:6183136-Pleurochrysis_carterae.AAC.1
MRLSGTSGDRRRARRGCFVERRSRADGAEAQAVGGARRDSDAMDCAEAKSADLLIACDNGREDEATALMAVVVVVTRVAHAWMRAKVRSDGRKVATQMVLAAGGASGRQATLGWRRCLLMLRAQQGVRMQTRICVS